MRFTFAGTGIVIIFNLMNKLLLLIGTATLFIFSCKKDSFITSRDAVIGFSSDTLFFDTVFTSTGSITEFIKINNLNDQKILLSGIRLMGGDQSPFKINIDGLPGPVSGPVEIAANDSLYIFVSVTVNPTAAHLPFLLNDSIEVAYNGNTHYIQLQAWGQNAHFLQNAKISGNSSWTNDLPYVILGSLTIDSNATLTIQQGCRIYFHADAPLLVNGSLLVNGGKDDSSRVYFLGDRLDDPYNEYPGSWPGIFFLSPSKDNVLSFAIIKNAYQGIIVADPAVDGNPKLELNECIIDNIYDAGILASQTNIEAQNCLVSNCGKNIVLGGGGNYTFTHCTVASFSNDYIQHLNPVLTMSNYSSQGSTVSISGLTAAFTNCIFWGDNGTVDDEINISRQGTDSLFSISFSNCLLKLKDAFPGVDSSHIILNSDPAFDSVNNQKRFYDFHLKSGSPAIDQGKNTGIPVDLDSNARAVGLPDLGCYEKQ